MGHDLPDEVLPIFTKIDERTLQIGICDRRSGEILDCCRYVVQKQITRELMDLFIRDFRADLIENGVI